MGCVNCEDGRVGGTCRCGDCIDHQNDAIFAFFCGNATIRDVLQSFGVADRTENSDIDVRLLTVFDYEFGRKNSDGSDRAYDKRYWGMAKALIDGRSDMMKLQTPSNVCESVRQMQSRLWDMAES